VKKSLPRAEPPDGRAQKWNDTRGPSRSTESAIKTLPNAVPAAIDSEKFSWSVRVIDHEYAGGWDWKLEPKEVKGLLELLESLQEMTWKEVKSLRFNSKKNRRQLHHSEKVTVICKEAQERLDQIGLGDQEELYRLRHGNTVRVWGFRDRTVFCILWYDRNHRVYPQEK